MACARRPPACRPIVVPSLGFGRAQAHQGTIMIHAQLHRVLDEPDRLCRYRHKVEIFFSVIQKKVVSPNDFASLEHLSETLLAFIDRYNQTARPFNWKYTAADLTELLHRISEREQATAIHQTDLVTAA